MGLTNIIQRFYQGNIANGEFAKHKKAYATFFITGYLMRLTMCSPGAKAQAAPLQSGAETAYHHVVGEREHLDGLVLDLYRN